jgi:hypothetical protein
MILPQTQRALPSGGEITSWGQLVELLTGLIDKCCQTVCAQNQLAHWLHRTNHKTHRILNP